MANDRDKRKRERQRREKLLIKDAANELLALHEQVTQLGECRVLVPMPCATHWVAFCHTCNPQMPNYLRCRPCELPA